MCEWLSNGDWCDIQLYCSGHTFNAHRAVLASVSSFLRSVLLSCQSRDSTVCIILPDFDLDAMTFVLHYIYHGEVAVPQCRLNLFLDIVQALKIYIDPQYLRNTNSDLPISPLDLTTYNESTKINNYAMASCVNDEFSITDERLKDFKKRSNTSLKDFMNKVQSTEIRDKLWRRFFREKLISSADWSFCNGEQKTNLRDLFIETYTQNGNDNGLTAGVLAISSEHYRSPASVLFTNANGGHSNDAVLEPCKITPDFRSHLTPASKSPETYKNFYIPLKNNHCEILSEEMTQNEVYENNANDTLKCFYLNKISKRSECENNMMFRTEHLLDLRQFQSKVKLIVHKVNEDSSFDKRVQKHEKNENMRKNKYLEVQVCKKEAMKNQIKRNPWVPQSLFFYKPFRKKSAADSTTLKMELDLVNDTNNNINETIPPLNSMRTTEERVVNSDTRDASGTSHSLRLGDENEFKCTACNRVFECNELLMAHMRRHSTSIRYNCGECSKTFSQLRNYKYHMSVHRGTKEFAATCPVCGKYFNDRGYLSSHMKIHRNRKEYKCSMCPKSFNQRVAYNMHVRIHTGLKPHVCDECGKAFSRKMLLKQHLRTHSGERPYACIHCDKRFADRSNMTLHLRLHTGVKPFACTICPKSFTKKHHLKSHLNFHTGAKPYSCPRCKVTFTQSSNMRTHFKKCTASASPSPVKIS